MPNISLHTRLIVGVIVPLLVISIPFAVVNHHLRRNEAVQSVELLLRELTNKRAVELDARFFAAAQIAETLAIVLSHQIPETPEIIEAILRDNVAEYSDIIGACVGFEPYHFRPDVERFAPYVCRDKSSLSANMFLTSDLTETYPTDYRTWEWYTRPLQMKTGGWGEPYHDTGGSDTLICTYSTPFFKDGVVAGVATVDISLAYLQQELSAVSPQGAVYRLISPKGQIAVAPEPEFVMQETLDSLAKQYDHLTDGVFAHLTQARMSRESGVLHTKNIRGEPIWCSYTTLPTSHWFFTASIEEQEVLRPVQAALTRSVVSIMSVLVAVILIILIVTHRLVAPIKKLAIFAGELAGGNLDAKVGVAAAEGGTEIEQLARTFDKMVVDLKSNIEQRIKEESARKMVEGELRVARRIQASLLPRKFPPFPGHPEFDLFAMNEPAAFVAGDFYDYFFLDEENLGIIIADVSGHGVPAAMFMAVARTAIRNYATAGRSPTEIIRQTNETLCNDNDDMMFVTMFYAHYNVKTGELRYVNAGHNPPYILRTDGTLQSLPSTGPLVAAIPGASFAEETVSLQPNDRLFFFTDGLTEAHTEKQSELFGEARLEKLLQDSRKLPFVEFLKTVYESVNTFCAGEHHDDMTLMVLQRNTVQ